MFYTVYKTLNLVTGRAYIGKHQTLNPLDSYLGSGIALKGAIAKYGRANFKKEILYVFDNEQDMNSCERRIVTNETIASCNLYNLCPGGEGGALFTGKRHSLKTKLILASKRRGSSFKKTREQIKLERDSRYAKNNGLFFSEETICKIKEKSLLRAKRTMSLETRLKISETLSKRYQEDLKVSVYERTPEIRVKISKSRRKSKGISP